jgi:hypothetical protein
LSGAASACCWGQARRLFDAAGEREAIVDSAQNGNESRHDLRHFKLHPLGNRAKLLDHSRR